ncbi:hypothetical protein JCM33374_g2924 [Metschnikowia sp. JCM 33374]|nr:hypothetical protein JCM33374_g2924 [Metschnikowia sp. JCM 33374]
MGAPTLKSRGFSRTSGVKSPYSFSSWSEIAAIVHNQNNVMGLTSGNLVCVPPHESALAGTFIDDIIEAANAEALVQGVKGKELTPFLLKKIAIETGGRSVECNKHFVINNADAACKIAKELCELKAADKGVPFSDTAQPVR